MSAQKKIMFLGGIYYLKPAIDAAHALGCYVITCDNVPNNVAHQWSDEYINASIVDKELILKIAQEKQIDGILSYAVDPGVVTAAYVAEKMGLPSTCGYDAACILQDKVLFRIFLAENGFNAPWAFGFSNYDEVLDKKADIKYPAIVKPVDSAGSKGVQRIDHADQLKAAFDTAIKYSISKNVIVEEFLQKKGRSYGAEVFVNEGQLVFASYYDQFFEESAVNPYVPYAESWSSSIPPQAEREMNDTIQRICSIMHVRTGIFNIECRQTIDNKMYIMEMSPRAGGNRLAELIRCATGCDIIFPEIQKAIQYSITPIKQQVWDKNYAILVMHTMQSGTFHGITINDEIERKNVLSKDLYVQEGDETHAFGGANNAIGSLFMCFETKEEMEYTITHQTDWLAINIK